MSYPKTNYAMPTSSNGTKQKAAIPIFLVSNLNVSNALTQKSISFPKSILSGLPRLPQKTKRVRLKVIQVGKEQEILNRTKDRKVALDIHIQEMEKQIRAKKGVEVAKAVAQESKRKEEVKKAKAPLSIDNLMEDTESEKK
ncbi:hypothetical protein FGO68_gene12273 [Halteria grandinella]|uniref:Uncharacterized protein n=1 Tax=Halteria grandinella TaxID=5974 RepID=A0A8J8NU15_HALGN|nr:hypothetical protein FGO68_gene12273 [Halteria grandinella]